MFKINLQHKQSICVFTARAILINHHHHHHQRLFIVRLLQLDHRCITTVRS